MATSALPLPPVYRFDPGDYQGSPSWFQKFISNANLFTLNIYNLMNGGIGFANLQRAVYSTTLTAGSTNTALSFVNPLSISPSGLTLVKCMPLGNTTPPVLGTVSVATWFFDGKSINIPNITGLNAGSSYQFSLEVF